MTLWRTIALDAERESALWRDSLRPEEEREEEPIFSALADERYALGLETIYEGYLVHYGRPRLFAPPDGDVALLLGDYLYAQGLVHVAELGEVDAIRLLSALISRCAHLRGEGRGGDGETWADTAAALGGGGADGRADALAAHARRIDSAA